MWVLRGSSRLAARFASAPLALPIAALISISMPAPLCSATEALAERPLGSAPGANGWWWSVGALGGSMRPDAKLADYQWATSPRSAWGLRTLAGSRWFSGGSRTWNTRAEQLIGAPGAADAVSVRGTSWDVIGRGRLLRVGGADVLAIASGGRLHLGYEPDRVTITSQSGSSMVVDLASIDEWNAGLGLALERRISGVWKAGIEVERRFFGLDTAHREGDVIVERREALGDWNARVELAWLRASR